MRAILVFAILALSLVALPSASAGVPGNGCVGYYNDKQVDPGQHPTCTGVSSMGGGYACIGQKDSSTGQCDGGVVYVPIG
ncbi:MAG: hypothetical protein QOE90_2530 [Thermoplasmata archaeon]|jgi:hypothetical protein|nr:hypothetical protein [Thermoplasmata archaeon]